MLPGRGAFGGVRAGGNIPGRVNIFVQQGGSLILGSGQIAGNIVTGGGPAGYTQGAALGAGLFLQSGARIASGATLTLADGVAGPGTIDLGQGAILLPGLAGATTSYSPATHLFTATGGTLSASFTLAAAPVATMAGADLLLAAACYAAGTRIATETGERPIETIRPGQRVHSAFGGLAEVIWVGHRRMHPARHARPWDVAPVRLRAGAMADGVPSRDLLLSPDHAIRVGDALIPVRYLVNGATIVQEMRETLVYWHIETAQHDCILAEGLAAETYLDTGNRAAFEGHGPAIALHPAFARAAWEAAGCLELVVDGAQRVAAHAALRTRALALGHLATPDPSFHLRRDPRGVRLLSRAGVPAEHDASQPDRRRLGVAVAGLTLDGNPLRLDDPRLAGGWHEPEPAWRWTTGVALVLAPPGARLEVRLAPVDACYWTDTRKEQGRQNRQV